MQRLQGKIQGPVYVEKHSSLHGVITGGVVVRKDVTFHVHGVIIGELTVEAGAEVTVHGVVNGTIWNFGHVLIYGTIVELVDSGPESHSVIHRDALVSSLDDQRLFWAN